MAGKEWSDADFGGLPSVLVAAHELKTPLALIRQLALLLDDDLTSSADKTQIQQRGGIGSNCRVYAWRDGCL
jgi:hypothetical protein